MAKLLSEIENLKEQLRKKEEQVNVLNRDAANATKNGLTPG